MTVVRSAVQVHSVEMLSKENWHVKQKILLFNGLLFLSNLN